MPQTILITGASTGFGRLAAHSLALAGHTVYAGQYSHDGNITPYIEETTSFSEKHNVILRSIPLDLLSDDSVSSAIAHIGDQLTTVIHNAGHMSWGPAESFTPQQYTNIYAVNVVGAQRLNQAFLPLMRKNRRGHVIWISSSSVHGAKSPMLGPYFAAKAAMDSLAQTYARELNPWGIETSIVSPGVFTKGTNHFADAMKPGVEGVAKEYEEGPTKGVSEQAMKGTAGVVPEDADPIVIAEALVRLVALPRGERPFRVFVDPAGDGCDVAAPVADRMGDDFYRRLGLGELLKVAL